MVKTGRAKYFLLALLLMLAAVVVVLTPRTYGQEGSVASGAASGEAARELKFLADFEQQSFSADGRQLSRDDISIEGAASVIPGEGLAAYKGGVNEIIDPSFEGEGWVLGDGAAIDTVKASQGKSSLRVSGNGATRVFASLKEPVPVVTVHRESTTSFVGETRAVSFDYDCGDLQGGAVKFTIIALGAGGEILGESSSEVTTATRGWRRDKKIVFDLPAGTDAYTLEVAGDGFTGTSYIDACMSEHKDYFTPYYDGDSEKGAWVEAGTPQNFYAEPSGTSIKMLVKGGLLAVFAFVVAAGSIFLFVRGIIRRKMSWIILSPAIGLSLLVFAAVSLGVVRIPEGWPLKVTFQGSSLEIGKTYFYRLSAVDGDGNESPASIEGRVKTDWIHRKSMLIWDNDPGAVKYRIYRGDNSREEDEFVEVDGGTSMYIDRGQEMAVGKPASGNVENTAAHHASRSLRPDTDVRVSNDIVGLDTEADFWVTGELQTDFATEVPFRPCSFFEIGNPKEETNFAVSVRYVPTWGDAGPHILAIVKNKGQMMADYGSDPIPAMGPGAVIRYVAEQLLESSGDMQPGMHLWYRINDGEVKHVYVEHDAELTNDVLIIISKRYYLDYFSNNSITRSFAIIQGTVNEAAVNTIMGPGTVPEQLQLLD